jgi:hypothetical protein
MTLELVWTVWVAWAVACLVWVVCLVWAECLAWVAWAFNETSVTSEHNVNTTTLVHNKQ